MLEFQHPLGYTILVGRNRDENQQLIDESGPDDYWVHISEFPSAHAVIRRDDDTAVKPPLTVIKHACSLVKQRSTQCKSMPKLTFDVTQVRHLQSTKVPGMVRLEKLLKHITL